MSLMTLANGLIRCLRRGSSPRVSESVKNWSLWTEKCPRPWWWHFLLLWLRFLRIFPKTSTWIYWRNFRSNGLSVKRSVKHAYLDRLITCFWDFQSRDRILSYFRCMMWKCDVNNHVSIPVLSPVLFFKAFDRGKSPINRSSKYRTGKLTECGIN